MIQNMYAVRDRKANAYLRPFICANHAVAIRSFMDVVSDAKHPFAMHPDDFALWAVGTFDDSTGKLLTADVQQEIAVASQALIINTKE